MGALSGTDRPCAKAAPGRQAGAALMLLLAAAAPATALAQCDLKAEFTAPAGTSLPGGQPVQWSLRFTNVSGSGTCAANKVRLQRSGGSTAVALGNVTVYRTLPALGPLASTTLTFPEATTPASGTYVYKPEYATPHDDADNANHHPSRTVTFSSTATLALPDLVVTEVLAGRNGVRVGACNTIVVRLKNAGSGIAPTTQLALAVVGPGTANAVADSRTVHVGGLASGQQQAIEIKGLNVPQAGSWRFVAAADSGKAVVESDETNNTGALRADAQQPCTP